jgi:hypothetical protein
VLHEEVAVMPKSKFSMLPLLVVLFLISYGLLVLLVVEQDRTIGAQRSLIRDLFSDTTELSQLKHKLMVQQRAAHPQAGAANPKEAPGTGKSRKGARLRPPKDASDSGDARRTPVLI